ncbi:hypothetical protein [Rhizobium ruizarguesonis]|uniref:Uncharacterized protein n=1 Tax=Rhizobium ruizarguesonis TaxID=2081791 RepID=A0ABY1X8K6_9HYPH|nr:hypothetical protein [Rhizobium ruizarguesonis]TAX81438.1 hypothetical protein ELH98_10415 [Rhizobium ruizarguesonis]
MAHSPHPVRILALNTMIETRKSELDNKVEERTSVTSGWKSFKEKVAIRSWAERTEMAGLTEDQLNLYEIRNRTLRTLAENVLSPSEDPQIYDVSDLMAKLPDHDIVRYSLGQLTLPHDNIYIDFGSGSHFKISAEHDLWFGGAYVSQKEVPGNDESYFSVTLVCGDVALEDAWEQPLGQTLQRTSNMIRAEFDGTKTIAAALSSDFAFQHFNADDIVRSNRSAITAAFDAVARSMIYLGTYQPDLEVGCDEEADEDDLQEFLEGDRDAAQSLITSGFPPVNFVGRAIDKIEFLDEPDFDRDHMGFKI